MHKIHLSQLWSTNLRFYIFMMINFTDIGMYNIERARLLEKHRNWNVQIESAYFYHSSK